MTSNKNTLYYNYIDKWVWLPFLLVSLIAIVFIVYGCNNDDLIIPCGEIEIDATSKKFTTDGDIITVNIKDTVKFNYEYKSENYDTIGKYRTWIFGDNDTLYTINKAKHKYSKAGKYIVSVDGCEGSMKLVVEIDDEVVSIPEQIPIPTAPVANFNIPHEIKVEDPLQLVDMTVGEITSRKWYVNNRFVSNEISYSHTFEIEGQYTISLVVNEDSGSEKRSTIRVTPSGESIPPPPPTTPAIKIVSINQPTSYTLTGNGNDRITYTFRIKNTGNTIISNIEITGIEAGIRQLDIDEKSNKYEYPLSIRQLDIDNGSVQSVRITVTGRANNGREVIDTWDTNKVPIVINSRPPQIDITSINSPDRFEYENVGDKIELYTINIENTGGTILRNIRIEKPSSLECINCPDSLNDGESFQIKASYTIRQKDVNNGEILPKIVTIKTKFGNTKHSDKTKSIFLQKKSPPKCPTISKEDYADKLKKYVTDSKEKPEIKIENTKKAMNEFLSYVTTDGKSFGNVIIKYKKFDISPTYITGTFSDLYNSLHAHNNLKDIVIEEMKINSENQCIQSLKLKYGRKIF